MAWTVLTLARGHMDQNRLVISTIHSAKGMEFDATVLIAGSWLGQGFGLNAKKYGTSAGRDALNLVGLTRPKRALLICA